MSTDNNIPLLTDIIQLGDVEMKNHFDGHVFDEDNQDMLDKKTEEVPEIKIPNDNDAELDELQLKLLTDELNDIDLSIPDLNQNIENTEQIETIETLENTEAIDNDTAVAETTSNTLSKKELSDMVSLLVSDAVDSTLPMIETQLKQQITEQILQKLSKKIA